VDDTYPSFHSHRVGPKTAERVDAGEIGDQDDKRKDAHRYSHRRPSRTIFLVNTREDYPTGESYLNQYPEKEGLAGYERRNDAGYDYERKERDEEYGRNGYASNDIFHAHSEIRL